VKDYPSIPFTAVGQKFLEIPGALVFDKLDGSSMRSEWTKKQGWCKHGKRHGLLDDSNPHLIAGPGLFMDTLAEPLEKIARDNRWQHLIVFYEFWGELSFAGQHEMGDPKFLSLFDVAADKKGIMSPQDFLRTFDGKVRTAAYLGTYNWTQGFIQEVWEGKIPGITFEGVVGKAGGRHDLVRAKAKTQAWVEKVRRVHREKADSIINS
jgi:hypothetical protein